MRVSATRPAFDPHTLLVVADTPPPGVLDNMKVRGWNVFPSRPAGALATVLPTTTLTVATLPSGAAGTHAAPRVIHCTVP